MRTWLLLIRQKKNEIMKMFNIQEYKQEEEFDEEIVKKKKDKSWFRKSREIEKSPKLVRKTSSGQVVGSSPKG